MSRESDRSGAPSGSSSSTPGTVVVGGGAIGACVALELARRGIATTLVERESSVGLGCSAGNMGLICPGHSAPIASPEALKTGLRSLARPDGPLYLRPRPALASWLARYLWACRPANAQAGAKVMLELSQLSLELHEELADQGLHDTMVRRGTLNVAETEEGLHALIEEAELNEAFGLDTRVLDGAGVRELEPALADHVAGGVYYPNEAHCDSLAFVESVGRAAEEAGATIRTGVEVLRLERRGDRVTGLDTTAGRIDADLVVLAGGSWSRPLGATAGVDVPVQGGKGYHLEIETGEGDPLIPAITYETRVAATPLAGRVRLGGTLELAGLDLTVSQRRVDAIHRAAERSYPALAGRTVKHVWRGLRPCSPDGVPIVGPTPGLPNLVLATGHTHMGLALAPVTGRLVAEHVAGEQPTFDVARLGLGRFARFGA